MSDLFSTSAVPAAEDAGCAGCARLESGPTVELLTGQTVCTWCPAWRQETALRQEEANSVLAMTDRATRLAHLESREREFGPEYRRRLERVVLETWKRRRARVADATGGA